MDVMKTAQAAVAAVSGELGTLREKKNSLGQRLIAIDAEIERLRKMPINKEDFRVYLDNFIDEQAKEYGQGTSLNQWLKRGEFEHPLDEQAWSFFEDEDGVMKTLYLMPDHGSLRTTGFKTLCFFFPEVVKEKLWQHFLEGAARRWTHQDIPPVAQRREQIAQLEAERETVDGEYLQVNRSIAEIQEALKL